jgi:hypothetical protein
VLRITTAFAPPQTGHADDKDKYPTSFSPDGILLLYMVYYDPASKNQLWILPLEGPPGGERKPAPFAQTGFNATWGQFSPHGRWIAYASDESQRSEIYVAPFPGPAVRNRSRLPAATSRCGVKTERRSSTLPKTVG